MQNLASLPNHCSALMEMTSHLRGVQPHPRATTTAAPQKGYSSVEGARKVLNDMIYKSMGKYDEPCKAKMYQHGDFKGWKADLKARAYYVKDMKKKRGQER